MSIIIESMKIKKDIQSLTVEEFDKILYDCGIESIKPSIKSEYVRCLNMLVDVDYRKNVPQYIMQDEYFEIEKDRREVA